MKIWTMPASPISFVQEAGMSDIPAFCIKWDKISFIALSLTWCISNNRKFQNTVACYFWADRYFIFLDITSNLFLHTAFYWISCVQKTGMSDIPVFCTRTQKRDYLKTQFLDLPGFCTKLLIYPISHCQGYNSDWKDFLFPHNWKFKMECFVNLDSW